MVITFDSSNVAVIAYEILKNRLFDEKKLLVIMLPTIEPSMIPSKVLPLLVFVNVKSGGCQVLARSHLLSNKFVFSVSIQLLHDPSSIRIYLQGLELISSFRKLLNPYQVFDLSNGGPLPG